MSGGGSPLARWQHCTIPLGEEKLEINPYGDNSDGPIHAIPMHSRERPGTVTMSSAVLPENEMAVVGFSKERSKRLGCTRELQQQHR